MAAIIPVSFVGADTGTYRVLRMEAVAGTALPPVPALALHAVHLPAGAAGDAAWVLRGTNAYVRYVNRLETSALQALQPPIGRPNCTHAALIPIRKTKRKLGGIFPRTSDAKFSRNVPTTLPHP